MTRIVVTGASGSGTTTLGAELATRLGCRHFDADDAFWVRTDPPFTTKRDLVERDAMIRAHLAPHDAWVLSGSVVGWPWPDPHRDLGLAVFLSLPSGLRMARLRAREIERYGADAVAPGGRMHAGHVEFLAWAERYDSAGTEQRSRVTHEAWLARCACPVLRIDGDTTVADRVARVLAAVPSCRASA